MLQPKFGMSVASNKRNAGVPALATGPAKTLFCPALAQVAETLPLEVTAAPVVNSLGNESPTLVTVPALPALGVNTSHFEVPAFQRIDCPSARPVRFSAFPANFVSTYPFVHASVAFVGVPEIETFAKEAF